MDSRHTRLGLAILLVTALTVRVAAVALLFDASQPPPAYEHGEIARNVMAGRGFRVSFLGQDGPTSQQAPLYPALLAACYAAFGPDSPTATLTLQVLQCLAGGVLTLVVARLCWLLLPEERSVGWWVGAWTACDPAQVYLVTHVQVAVWAALLLTATVFAALAPWTTDRRRAMALGGLAGVTLLVEPIYALVLPVLLLATWCKSERRTEFPRAALTMSLTVAFVLAPWLIRNRLVHGEWVFVKSTFGYAFWQGNNPHSYGTDKIPKPSAAELLGQHDGTLRGQHAAAWAARRETLYIDDVLLKPNGYREFAGLSEPQRSALLGARAWDFVRQRPADYVRLCGRRLRYLLLFDDTNPKAAHRVFRAATVVWLTLTGVGLIATGGRWRRLWPLAAAVAAVMLFHCLTISSVRFRLALQPLTFVFGSLAVAGPAGRVYRRLTAAWGVETSKPAGPEVVTLSAAQPGRPATIRDRAA